MERRRRRAEEEKNWNARVRSDSAKLLPTHDLPFEKQKPYAIHGQACKPK